MVSRYRTSQAAPVNSRPGSDGLMIQPKTLVDRIHATSSYSEDSATHRWGWMPILSLIMAVGLFLVSLAFRLSVSGAQNPDMYYWLGLLLLVTPAAARLASESATRQERLALVILLAMGLYLVKVMHSPTAYTYTDELVHYANAQQVLSTQRLFGDNSILRTTPNFPGLSAVTSAIASLSGLSIFTSGLLIIGAARLILTLGLFLIYEKLTDSMRVAGLASVLYMANSNYLYWSAQYAYESLALPLAVFVVFAVFFFLLRPPPGKERITLQAAPVVLIGVLAVTMTHHLTSFALIAVLGLAALFASVLRRQSREKKIILWILTFIAVDAVLFWNLVMAPSTTGYLLPVISRAIQAGLNIFTQGISGSGRTLFQSNTATQTPVWEQLVGISSVLLILVAIPLGLRVFWRNLRGSALAWVMVLATLAFFPIQSLRLTGPGWETANRASEFLFVGIALVISLAFLLRPFARDARSVAAIAAVFAGVLFLGGIIAGWPPALRLSQPYLVSAERSDGERVSIEPQGVAAAGWVRSFLGPGNRMAADNSSARLMQAYGEQYALAGSEFGIHNLFLSQAIGSGELDVLQVTGVKYLVFTRPLSRWVQMRGLYFNPEEGLPLSEIRSLEQGVPQKFDQNPSVERLLDTGLVVIYEIGGLTNVANAP